MGASRNLYPDEFKREALELLASSGRPLSQAAPGVAQWKRWGPGGIAAALQHAGGDPRLLARIWPPRTHACGARTSVCAWSGRS